MLTKGDLSGQPGMEDQLPRLGSRPGVDIQSGCIET